MKVEDQIAKPHRKSSRNSLRFSLAKLLGVVTLCALAFAWLRYPVEHTFREEQIANEVERLGGRVTWGRAEVREVVRISVRLT